MRFEPRTAKRCFRVIPCDISHRCALDSPATTLTRQHFQPLRVGEYCDHFTPRRDQEHDHVRD